MSRIDARLRRLEAADPAEDEYERAERLEHEAMLAAFLAQDVDPTPEIGDPETRQVARCLRFALAGDPEVEKYWPKATTPQQD